MHGYKWNHYLCFVSSTYIGDSSHKHKFILKMYTVMHFLHISYAKDCCFWIFSWLCSVLHKICLHQILFLRNDDWGIRTWHNTRLFHNTTEIKQRHWHNFHFLCHDDDDQRQTSWFINNHWTWYCFYCRLLGFFL